MILTEIIFTRIILLAPQSKKLISEPTNQLHNIGGAQHNVCVRKVKKHTYMYMVCSPRVLSIK